MEGEKIYGDNTSTNRVRLYYEYYFFKSFVMFWSFYIYISNLLRKNKIEDKEQEGIFEAI